MIPVSFTVIYPEGFIPETFPEDEVVEGERFEIPHFRFLPKPPKVGDCIEHEGHTWQIGRVFEYQSQDGYESLFYEVCCYSPDDFHRPDRTDWVSSPPIYRYFNVSTEFKPLPDSGVFFDLRYSDDMIATQYGSCDKTEVYYPVGDRPSQGFDQIFIHWLKERQLALA